MYIQLVQKYVQELSINDITNSGVNIATQSADYAEELLYRLEQYFDYFLEEERGIKDSNEVKERLEAGEEGTVSLEELEQDL